MIIYTKYVPHYYSPTFDLMDRILKTIKIYKALNYIPQIWNDLILLGYTNNIDLMQNLLSSMDEATKDEPLLQTFANIGKLLYLSLNNPLMSAIQLLILLNELIKASIIALQKENLK